MPSHVVLHPVLHRVYDLLLDWSAYARVLLAQAKPDEGRRLSSDQLELFDEAVALDQLHVCTPFRLEARYSARCSSEFAALSAELAGGGPGMAERWIAPHGSVADHLT